MKGGRKRVVHCEEGGRGGEKEKKRGGSEERIVENEGLGKKSKKEKGEEEEEEEEEEHDEDENKEDEGEVENDDEKGQRTKLDDGFFEIEAIRRKRVRKGQLQYLIKWQGWPETSNTWEPLENLQSCSDVVDAFEETLCLGKHNQKRKRKYAGIHIQSKKQQLRSSAATYNVTGLEVSVVDKSSLVPLDNSDGAGFSATSLVTVPALEGESNVNTKNFRKSNRVKENGSSSGSKIIDQRKDQNDYDTKLRELKGGTSSSGVNAIKYAIRFQGSKASEGDGLANGLPKVDNVESVQNDHRTGAKRRKSGSVKRFKQDLSSFGSNLTQMRYQISMLAVE